MTVRRLTPSRSAASVNDNPSSARQAAKSTPDIGRCSSAIRRRVVAERSSRPHSASVGQATPSPPSTIRALANARRVILQGGEMSAARHQSGQIDVVILLVPAKPDAQLTVADSAQPRDFGHSIDHRSPLELVPQPKQVRTILLYPAPGYRSALFGAWPARTAPSAMRIFAAKSAPLICTCGGFSSWKNISSLKAANRLISGIPHVPSP